ncbi:MAG: hypothetical protein EKK64_05865 [Neisseriaceae bacterium]|nr:MAG: hypothetical protein EKK64_05865 [Neisseriaceae bacterium]
MYDYDQLLVEIIAEHHNHSKWNNAIFGGIKTINNTKVGLVGQMFIEKLCNDLKLDCQYPMKSNGNRENQSPWDIKISGIKFELKTATEDVSNNFQFNHIRYHRDYDALICLGISPDKILFNVWTKAEVTTGKAGKLISMEKNANASYKLTKSQQGLHKIELFKIKIEDLALKLTNL